MKGIFQGEYRMDMLPSLFHQNVLNPREGVRMFLTVFTHGSEVDDSSGRLAFPGRITGKHQALQGPSHLSILSVLTQSSGFFLWPLVVLRSFASVASFWGLLLP